MDLKDFVREALTQIVAGVAEAQAASSAGTISPYFGEMPKPTRMESGEVYLKGTKLQPVEFDVAVTVSEETAVSGRAGAGISIVSVRGEGSTTSTRGAESRIKFTVPVILPTSPIR